MRMSSSRKRRSRGHDRSASAPPIGTPVCFNEKMKLRMRSGVRSARIAELEGVTGPYPRPITSAPSATSQALELAISAIPLPHSSSESWLIRQRANPGDDPSEKSARQ